MPLETATYIAGLVPTNPSSGDQKSQGDDHLRLVKSVLQNTFAGFPGLVVATGAEAAGGTTNDFVVTVAPAPAAYTASMLLLYKATHANTGPATLAVNALGARTLLGVDGAALAAADIESGSLVAAFYDGTSFFLLSGNDRAARDGETYAGAHNFTGALVQFLTQPIPDSSDNPATTLFVGRAIAAASLPSVIPTEWFQYGLNLSLRNFAFAP